MPAKDHYHDVVVRALIKDGWTITREQVELYVEPRTLRVDIEATKEATGLIVLVEVKGFEHPSPMTYIANAVGQYLLYETALETLHMNIPLYLAVPVEAYEGLLAEELAGKYLLRQNVRLLIYDPEKEEIIQWII